MAKSPSKTVLIYGASGRMGHELTDILANHKSLILGAAADVSEIRVFDKQHTAILKNSLPALTAVVEAVDYIIDFSSPKGSDFLSQALSGSKQKTVLVGTTGLPDTIKTKLKQIAKRCGHKILLAGNTSLGIATLARLAVNAAHALEGGNFDIEIIETHHRLKADTPSGTALLLAQVLQRALKGSKITFQRSGKRVEGSIGIHSIRGGGVFGEHEIRFLSDYEEVRLSHRAFNRVLFANGAIKLIAEVDKKLKSGSGLELSDFLLS